MFPSNTRRISSGLTLEEKRVKDQECKEMTMEKIMDMVEVVLTHTEQRV